MTTNHNKSKSPDELRERCLAHFATLNIPLRSAQLDQALEKADHDALSHLAFLENLIGHQVDQRRERSTERRIRQVRFQERKTLETFDWKFNPKAFDKLQIEQLASADFIRRRANLIFVGQSGVGKSHIMQAIGIRACALGFRPLYRTSADLIADLTASLADKTLPQKLRRYKSPDLLIIDEFGFDRIERSECPEAAHLLYKIIAARHQYRSTALVTNVDFEKWADYLADGPLAMAFLDILVEGAIILKINGKSFRARRSHTAHAKDTSSDSPRSTTQP